MKENPVKPRTNLKVLDLYCGAGGASMGFFLAGFETIVGVDINPQRYYPFKFCLNNALYLLKMMRNTIKREFDIIWASPPCQKYSKSAHRWRKEGREYQDLIDDTRKLLQKVELPYVIENVPGAPIRKDLVLCGTMFDIRVLRHRYFEIEGFIVEQPQHKKHEGTVKNGDFVTVAGHGGNDNIHNYCKLNGMEGASKLEVWKHAMDIHWINDLKEIAQCVPPAYAKYIAEAFISADNNTNPNQRGE